MVLDIQSFVEMRWKKQEARGGCTICYLKKQHGGRLLFFSIIELIKLLLIEDKAQEANLGETKSWTHRLQVRARTLADINFRPRPNCPCTGWERYGFNSHMRKRWRVFS